MTPTSWASLPRTRVLAQLTVFDARHGDCNLLDYCLDPYGDITDRKSWVRTLIDTGTNKDSIRASVVEGITSVGFPRPPNIEAGQMPYNNVDEIVITHADEDHIGNAGNIMSYLSEALLRNCRVLMPGPGPNVYPKPSIVRTASEWHLNFTGNGKAFAAGDEGVNVARFQAVLEAGWRDMMTRGFAVDVTFSSTPLDWTTHGAEWVRNTGAVPFSDQQLTLVYSKRFTGSDMASLIIQVACQVTLHTPRWKEDPTKEPAKGNKKRPRSQVDLAVPEWSVTTAKRIDGWNFMTQQQRERFQFPAAGLSSGHNYKPDLTWMPGPSPSAETVPEDGGGGEGHHDRRIRSLPDKVTSVYSKVKNLNTSGNAGIMVIQEPHVGQDWPASTPGYRRVVGPPEKYRDEILRETVIYALSVDPGGNDNFTASPIVDLHDFDSNKDLVNRASVMTLYHQRTGIQPCSMLFTGDAYGECLVHSDVIDLLPATPQAGVKMVTLLKVPHHGSWLTGVNTASNLFGKVLADFYLICAAPVGTRNHPDRLTLEAIIGTFNHPLRKTRPTLIFSNPAAIQESGALKAILHPESDFNPTKMNYNIYSLAGSKDMRQAARGRMYFWTADPANEAFPIMMTSELTEWVLLAREH